MRPSRSHKPKPLLLQRHSSTIKSPSSRRQPLRQPLQRNTTPTTEDSSPGWMRRPSAKSRLDCQAKHSFLEELNLSSSGWCLYDSKTRRYVGFRDRHARQIASLTKIMTALVALEFLQSSPLQSKLYVKVTDTAAKMNGTSADLRLRTWVNIWDLLYGTMLPSGNDAAYLLAESIGYLCKLGDKELAKLSHIDLTGQNTTKYVVAFIKMMNRKSEQLKLKETTFSNPHGLENALNTSSPRDLIELCRHATANVQFRTIMNTEMFHYLVLEEQKGIPFLCSNQEILQSFVSRQKKRWWNTNALLKKGWEGVKTGQTPTAGGCLASLREGIFIVVLNCRDSEARFTETERIFGWYVSKGQRHSTEQSDSSNL